MKNKTSSIKSMHVQTAVQPRITAMLSLMRSQSLCDGKRILNMWRHGTSSSLYVTSDWTVSVSSNSANIQ